MVPENLTKQRKENTKGTSVGYKRKYLKAIKGKEHLLLIVKKEEEEEHRRSLNIANPKELHQNCVVDLGREHW